MKVIHVTTSRNYDVFVGTDLLSEAGSYIHLVKPCCTAVIVSDTNVFPLYGPTLTNSLVESGYHVISYTFSPGESSKNPTVYLDLLNFLSEHQVTRTDLIIALGGGVTGDLSGFAAATYLRGVSYVQVPTSLLAMVDSSVGGKTAVNLPTGKNLVGAFYQPDLVLCDISTLNTLPHSFFIDGCGEIIKYAILYDKELFATLDHSGIHFPREDVISRCISLKRDVVAMDEHDTGPRQMLNLGHTIGHGIEACSNFSISHGHAIAAGISIICKAGANNGLTDNQTAENVSSLLEKFSLPTTVSYPASSLFQYMLSDKKRSSNSISLIIPQQIGICRSVSISISELEAFIETGLST